MYNVVYTMYTYYDGPRTGVADLNGEPHFYESRWTDTAKNGWQDSFLLTPLRPEVLPLIHEAWIIANRWDASFSRGKTTLETYPYLPEDRERGEQLDLLLDNELKTDPARAVLKQGRFEPYEDEAWSKLGWYPLRVHWSDVNENASASG